MTKQETIETAKRLYVAEEERQKLEADRKLREQENENRAKYQRFLFNKVQQVFPLARRVTFHGKTYFDICDYLFSYGELSFTNVEKITWLYFAGGKFVSGFGEYQLGLKESCEDFTILGKILKDYPDPTKVQYKTLDGYKTYISDSIKEEVAKKEEVAFIYRAADIVSEGIRKELDSEESLNS